MAFKIPSVKPIIEDISQARIYLRSVKKWGKSTLFRDVVLEKGEGDPGYGLLCGVGLETGYDNLDQVNSTQLKDWGDFVGLKKWLFESNDPNATKIKMVAFDTVDEIIPIAEAEIIKQSNKNPKFKKSSTINEAMGGFGRGAKAAEALIKEYFEEFREKKIGLFLIGHTQVKAVKEKGGLDEEGYDQLTSNLSRNYENVFGDKMDYVLTGVIDRNYEEEIGKNAIGMSVTKRHVTSEVRKLYLRGTSFIDAGCRFLDDAVPEYIVFDKVNNAKEFIETIEEGMRLNRLDSTPKTKKMVIEEIKTPVINKAQTKEETEIDLETVNPVIEESAEEVSGESLTKEVDGETKEKEITQDEIKAYVTTVFQKSPTFQSELVNLMSKYGAEKMGDLGQDGLREVISLGEKEGFPFNR